MKSISLVLALLILPSCSGIGLLGELLYQRNTRAPSGLNFGTDLAIPGLAMVERVEALPATTNSSMPNGTYTYNVGAANSLGCNFI